jgi:HAD superfamily hydrolase (TIGR01509 family)
MNKKAVIFDMDGVISDTQTIHSRIWSEVMAGYGVQISPAEITLRYAGAKSREIFTTILAEHGLEDRLEEALGAKDRLYAERAGSGVMAISGAPELIRKLARDGRDLAVASGGGRENVEWVLQTLKLRQYFPVVVTASDVEHGKPSPDLFLLAAQLLERHPADCVVIEDSRNGMLAARQAGMYCIGLVTDREDHQNYPADRLVESLTGLGPADF